LSQNKTLDNSVAIA